MAGEFIAANIAAQKTPCKLGKNDMAIQADDAIECGTGGVPSEQDLFFVSLGDELVRRNLPYLNDVSRQLVTLSTALAGGSIAILRDADMCFPWLRFVAIAIFLLALATSLLGMLPRAGEITRRAPNVIRRGLETALISKRRLCRIAAGLIVGGLVVVLVGLL